MNNPVLQSEQFERAAYALKHAFDDFKRTIDQAAEAAQEFSRSVDKLESLMRVTNDG